MIPRFLLVTVALAISSCAHSDSSGLSGDVLITGTWGGDNAGLILDDTIAHVHIGCTYGDFRAPLKVDAENRFTAAGSYMLRAYPVAVGPAVPAVLNGVVDGNSVTLTIAVNDTVQKQQVTLGPSKVTLGKDPRMGPCPICRTNAQRRRLL